MLKKLIALLLIALAAFAVVAAMQSPEMHVERSTTVHAPAEEVFAQINDLHKWEAWSPWARMDPNATATYSGPDAGKDASMAWKGNSDVGAGSMTITESTPSEHVGLRLDFLEPMPGTATSNFKLKEENGATTITWSMDSHKNFLAKAIGLVMNCEEMVGEQYDKGLANLKEIVEKPGQN